MRMLSKINIIDLWNSPTVMTWMSYSTKTISAIGVLPLILNKFSPNDIALYYLFSTLLFLQTLGDFGFSQTFSRIISYAFGGATGINPGYQSPNAIDGECNRKVNVELLSSVVSVMISVYRWLTLVVATLLSIAGSTLLFKPISESALHFEAWIAWAIIIVSTSVCFYLRIFTVFLEGVNQIALVKRVEAFTSLASIFSSIAVLIWWPSLLNIVIVTQFWVVMSGVRDWILCFRVENSLFRSLHLSMELDKELLKQVWRPAWRSGLGNLMSAGLTSLTSVIYAQFASAASLSSYLLAVRLITQIREISMAPFYSKLPRLMMCRARNDLTSLQFEVKRGMRMSHAVFVCGFILTSLFIRPIMHILEAKIDFVSIGLWGLLGWAFYAHRFGAMHLQVYLTSNKVISHIADGVFGVIYICSSYILAQYIGVYAIPISMLIGYLGFYNWFSAMHSYRSLGSVSFWSFEKDVSIPYIIILGTFSIGWVLLC